MNVAAFVIALIAGIIDIFMSGGFALLMFAMRGLGPLIGFIIILIPILAIVGGSFALARKRAGAVMLRICAGWEILVCLCMFFGLSRINDELARFLVLAGMSSAGIIPLIFAVLYSVATFCAFGGAKEAEEKQTVKTFEPILGVETPALIKRGNLFLEEGNFDESERYFEQALRQDPDNSPAYLGKLMAELKIKAMDNLPDANLSLSDNLLFQRALRFASEEDKAKLEGYAKINAEKFAAAQAERRREAEQVRQQAEQVRQLRRAGLSDYQIQMTLAAAKKRETLKNVPEEKTEAPGEKKVSMEGPHRQEAERQEQRKIREEQERIRAERNKKRMKLIAVIVIAGAAIYYGVGYYQEYAAAKRAEEARIARIEAEKQEEKSRIEALKLELQGHK